MRKFFFTACRRNNDPSQLEGHGKQEHGILSGLVSFFILVE